MRRSILFSLMVIGAVIAVVAGASTFSAFTDEARGTAAISSGTLDVKLNNDDGKPTPVTFSFTTGTLCSATTLAPDDVCTSTLTVKNDGSLSFTYTIEAWSDANSSDDAAAGLGGDSYESCFNVRLVLAPDTPSYATVGNNSTTGPSNPGANGYPGADDTDLAPTETQDWVISVTVDNDNACQAKSATIFVYILATQSASPHD